MCSPTLILRGVPEHIRSDNGSGFVAKSVRAWITGVGAKTAYIAPGSPWENGYVESVNARLRDELLDGKPCCSLREAQILIESGRRHDHTVRPHGSLRYRPPAPEVRLPAFTPGSTALTQPAPRAARPAKQRPPCPNPQPRLPRGGGPGESDAIVMSEEERWHRTYVPELARKPGVLRNGAPFRDWILLASLERVRRKLADSADGERQMIGILAAVLGNVLRMDRLRRYLPLIAIPEYVG